MPRNLAVASVPGSWVDPAQAAPHLVARDRIVIHGRERDIGAAEAWSASDVSHLWLYHLHYFDELAAPADEVRRQWRNALIDRWIRENPPCRGAGWDPYPASLRIVNWIKWHLAGNSLTDQALQSLAMQLACVESRLEFHILGNHLFENAKALCFGGCFFSGREPRGWWSTGVRLLERELGEQILADGGHFELSPMYHARMLENVLDVLNLKRAYRRDTGLALEGHAARMLDWLSAMTHPDGGVGLFNDAALGQAPDLGVLAAYAARLGLPSPRAPECPVHLLRASGYCRVTVGRWVALLDMAEIGPSYLPAHGHADALTFEISLDGRRLVVDSGTQTYEDCPERWYQRSTAAHNTIEIDGRSSSEVWKSFRVGRRARVTAVDVDRNHDACRVSAVHDGYTRLQRGLLCRRSWEFTDDAVVIADEISGSGRHEIAWRLHLHPAISVEATGERDFVLTRAGRRVARLVADPALAFTIEPAIYHPRFGSSEKSVRLTGRAKVDLPLSIRVTLMAERN